MLAILTLAACNSVRGAIDGDDVPGLATSFFVENDDAYDNDGAILVVLSSVDLGCEGYADAREDLEDEINALDVDGFIELWEETFPEDFWEVYIQFRVDDVDDSAARIDFDAQDWDDGLSEDDDAGMFMHHYTEYPDWSLFNLDFNLLADARDTYISDEGTVAVRRHKPGELISGYFDAPMVDLDGDDEGEARVSFSAQRCTAMEDYLL